jgi:probable HAF family extracellular repeat protein
MISIENTNAYSRLRVLVVAAVIGAGLGMAMAALAPPAPAGAAASERAGPDGKTKPGARPRTQFPAFVLDRGRFTTFEAPDPSVRIFPAGINDRGQISGEYLGPEKESGFLRDQRGRLIRIDLPGVQATQVVKLNDRGQIVGAYDKAKPFIFDPNGRARGFILERGKVTTIRVSGAVQTGVAGINDQGQVVGVYSDADRRSHGFMWSKGRFTFFDVPGAADTEPTDINDRGDIVGIYTDDPADDPAIAPDGVHGFLLDNGRYTTIDAPGVPITVPFGINDRGQIVGLTQPVPGPELTGVRGFLLAKGAKGPFTPISFPDAPRTIATGINDRGQIVGAYENPDAAPSGQRARMRMPMMMSDR